MRDVVTPNGMETCIGSSDLCCMVDSGMMQSGGISVAVINFGTSDLNFTRYKALGPPISHNIPKNGHRSSRLAQALIASFQPAT